MTAGDTLIARFQRSPTATVVADIGLIAGFVAALYWRLVFTAQTLPTEQFWSDLLTLTEPTFTYTGRHLAAGHLPLWNPYWFAGFPHLAMPSACVFYPTTVLFGVLKFEYALKLVILLHVYLAGIFAYFLGRELFGRRIPALYLALAIAGGNLFSIEIQGGQLWTVQSMAWLPLATLFVHRVVTLGRPGSAIGLALSVTLMFLGGDPQSTAFGLYFLAAYGAYLSIEPLIARQSSARSVLLAASLGAAGLGLGVALAAIQLIPSQELLDQSIRAQGVAKQYLGYASPSLAIYLRALFAFDASPYTWARPSAGAMGPALVLAALVFARTASARGLLFGGVLCSLYSLMPDWFYKVVISHLPVYDSVRGGFRMSFMVGFAANLLAASAIDTLWPRAGRRFARNWPDRIGAALFIVLLILIAHGYGESDSARAYLVPAGAFAALCLLAWPRSAFLAAAATVGLACLLTWRVLDAVVFDGDPARFQPHADFAKFVSSPGMGIDRIALAHPVLQRPFGQSAALGMMTGTRILQGYHGLIINRYARLFREVGKYPIAEIDDQGRLVSTGDFVGDWVIPDLLPLLDVFNVRYLVAANFARLKVPDGQIAAGQHFAKFRFGDLTVYRNEFALPPVFPIHQAITWPDDASALNWMKSGRFNFRRQATLTGNFDSERLQPATRPEPITLRAFEPEKIAVNVDLSAPALVVFSEIYYPGWHGRVDGVPAEVLCVDTALRGVFVEAGVHSVELEYRPTSLKIGAVCSGAALAIVAAWAAALLARRRRRITTARTSIAPLPGLAL